MHFSKRNLFLFLVFFSFISHLLFNLLVAYTEKTSFIWYKISQRDIKPKTYDFAIMGDSQIMSGIHSKYLKKELDGNGKQSDILYYPRPSEQPEGIFNSLLNFKKAGIKFKTLVINISPVTTSKNTIVDSHKSLALNFQTFSYEMIKDIELNKFYLKNLSNTLYYLLIQVFPLLKLNGNFSNEIRLIPGSEGIQHNKTIDSFLEVNFWGNLMLNKNQNLFLEHYLEQEDFYFEWGSFNRFSGNCIERKNPLSLPVGIEAAFLSQRKQATEFWLKLGEYARENGFQIKYIYIPFSPEAESKIGSNEPSSPIQASLTEIASRFGKETIIRIEPSSFTKEDFKDYTHLNVCGMMKLTKELASRL